MNFLKLAVCITSASLLMACGGDNNSTNNDQSAGTPTFSIEKAQLVLNTNADIAYAAYTDSVETAKILKTALNNFKADPSVENLTAAKTAWLVAREPYGQTEVYRFRNSPVDALDLEGDLNAWPLGEALIDYVNTGSDSAGGTGGENSDDFENEQIGVTAHGLGDDISANITVDNASTTNANNNSIIGNTAIAIEPALLAKGLQAGDEHDVISGYHAIEFILWGQDLNTTNGDTTDGTDRDLADNSTANGGQRPVTDFQPGITGDTYDSTVLSHRRHQYLAIVVDKLIADLEAVQAAWATGVADNYRAGFTSIATEADAKQKLTEILIGMGTLSAGELAGERIKPAFTKNAQEDEHSCFSDNTHRDIWLNAEGISNSFYGTYTGYDHDLDPTTADIVSTGIAAVNGYGIDDYLTDAGLESLVTETQAALTLTETHYTAIDTQARDEGKPFDVQIMAANRSLTSPAGLTITALEAQARLFNKASTDLGLDL